MNTLTTGELCRTLRAEGFENARAYRIRHAVEVGHVDRPTRDAAGNWAWTRRQVQQVRRYLANVPQPGRKAAAAV